MKENETIEAEIVEDEFLAPVLKNAKELTTLVNTDELIKKYRKLANIDLETPVDEIAKNFIEIEKGFKAFRKARTSLERTRKEIGEPAFQFHKKVIEIAKEIQKTINPYENSLKALVAKVENEEKRKQIEAEEAEEARIHEIKTKILNVKNLPLQHFNSSVSDITKALESLVVVSVDVYDEFYDDAVENQNYVIAQLQQARDNKILVENAKKIQDDRDAETARLKEIEDKKLQDERDEFNKKQAEFQKQKDDFNRQQREQQEIIDRQKAEIEAEEMQKKQEAERVERERIAKIEAEEMQKKQEAEKKQRDLENKERYEALYNESWDDLKEACKNPNDALLDLIIDGKIRHIKFEV